MTGWKANSPATAVMYSEFCRDIRGWTRSMHFPALYPSAPMEQSSLCLWFTGLLSRQPEAIPFHAWTLPYPHLQFYHSANSVPEAPPTSGDGKWSCLHNLLLVITSSCHKFQRQTIPTSQQDSFCTYPLCYPHFKVTAPKPSTCFLGSPGF